MGSRIPFKNDGSFMEIFKQLQAEQERAALGASVIVGSSKPSKNEPSITDAPYNLDVILPKDHKATIAIESLVMRIAGLPRSVADLEIAKFDDKVEASKVDYKLSDIELPPEKPPPKLAGKPSNEVNPKELNAELTNVAEEQKAPTSARKRKSRWDAEQPIKSESSEQKPLTEIEASVIEAAKLAAQLAASGGKSTQTFSPGSTARQFTGGAALTDEQIKQIQYQKELQAMHEFILAQQRLKDQEQELMNSIAGVNYSKKSKKTVDGLEVKYEYDSDEECEGGTWEHRLRAAEMEATRDWAEKLTEMGQGKHHIGDFLPPDELDRFMETYRALKEGREPDYSDYKNFKLTCENVGFQMLEKMGWKEGEGLGTSGQGIVNPVDRGNVHVEGVGLGVEKPSKLTEDDDEFEAYRKRMMLAYRFRPNPLNNPRRDYY
ncbi:hypothetical protein Aperf_G00000042761 [Anoplocephala perfoliata]